MLYEVITDDIAFVILVDKEILLVSQDQIVEIRNGSTVNVKENQVVPAEQSIASYNFV